MTPAEINKILKERGIRQIDVVARLGMPKASRVVVSHVIHRLCRSRRIEAEISRVTEKPLHVLWPEWYDAEPLKSAKSRKRAA